MPKIQDYTEKTSPTWADLLIIADSEDSNENKKVKLENAPVSNETQAELDLKANNSDIGEYNSQSVIQYVSQFSAISSQQWVISDWTYIYVNSSTTCTKYTKTGSVVTTRTITTDVPWQTHKWSGFYYDNKLYIASWYNVLGEVWAILRLNSSDLTVFDYTLTEWGLDSSALARKSDGTIWSTSYNDIANGVYIQKYDSSLNYVATYTLEKTINLSYAYDGIEWDWDYLLANLHQWITGYAYIYKYYFDGTKFTLVQKIPHNFNWAECGQGMSIDPSEANTIWLNSQDESKIYKCTYFSDINSSLAKFARKDIDNALAGTQTISGDVSIASWKMLSVGTTNKLDPISVLSSNSTIPALGSGGTSKFGLYNLFSWTFWYGMLMGVLSNGRGYIQEQRVDGTATAYDLLLQPNGGNVWIWSTAPWGNLDVQWASTPKIITTNTTKGEAQNVLKSNTTSTTLFYRESDYTFWMYDWAVTFFRRYWPSHATYPNTASITDIALNQNVACAILTVQSTTKGFLPPKMTTAQKNAISSPVSGLIVFDTDLDKLQCYAWATWNNLF